ncbi:MAG: hypothetical protein ACRD93_02530 [Nitrososphaeraceae archaeon]
MVTMVQKYFNKYRITVRSKNFAEIECYDTSVSKNNPVADLRFYDNVNSHENTYLSNIDRIILIFYIDRFNDVYNLIRYEKPVYAYIDPQTLDGHVGSQQEPVGEEDIV